MTKMYEFRFADGSRIHQEYFGNFADIKSKLNALYFDREPFMFFEGELININNLVAVKELGATND